MRWRDALLVVLSLGIGPPIAAFVMIAGLTVDRLGLLGLARYDFAFFAGSVVFAYAVAWLPTLVVAIVNAAVSRFVKVPWRLLLALPVGAVAFAAMLGWLIEGDPGVYRLGDMLSLALGGAVASLTSVAIVEAFGRRSQRAS